jgi:hypothetical protein
VHFGIDNRFAASLERFEALIEDPELYPRMQRALPGMAAIEVLSWQEVDGVLTRKVRYTPRAEDKIPAFGRAVITPEMLIWTEESAFDRRAHRIDYRIEPNIPAKWRDRFASRGFFTFAEHHGEVARRIEGEVTVRVPLLGGIVERMIIKELKHSFAAEAAELTAWLAERA